jgi:hypothetical protein
METLREFKERMDAREYPNPMPRSNSKLYILCHNEKCSETTGHYIVALNYKIFNLRST